jgi:hypothetical protein
VCNRRTSAPAAAYAPAPGSPTNPFHLKLVDKCTSLGCTCTWCRPPHMPCSRDSRLSSSACNATTPTNVLCGYGSSNAPPRAHNRVGRSSPVTHSHVGLVCTCDAGVGIAMRGAPGTSRTTHRDSAHGAEAAGATAVSVGTGTLLRPRSGGSIRPLASPQRFVGTTQPTVSLTGSCQWADAPRPGPGAYVAPSSFTGRGFADSREWQAVIALKPHMLLRFSWARSHPCLFRPLLLLAWLQGLASRPRDFHYALVVRQCPAPLPPPCLPPCHLSHICREALSSVL